jgi:lipopolysaccharide/colanic/teichoic acid biosynthesis glycosyltransferase
MIDMLTMSAGLWLMHLLFREHLNVSTFYSSTSLIVIPAMITTTFAFANAYSRERTPLNIANTEGLVRGVCCAAILGLMSCIDRRTMPDTFILWTIIVLIYLLVLQRELIGALRNRRFSHSSDLHLSHDARGGSLEGLPLAVNPIVGSPAQSDIEASQTGFSLSVWLKRLIDVIGGSFLLVIALPVVLPAIVMIKLDSGGPALILQRRIGKGGVSFYMWKLRSMHADAPLYARSPTSDADPRLTKVGCILRRLSIDEIPQLLNVLRGDMSLVGPRPEMPFLVAQYGPYEHQRLRVTPGITGLWQISPARAMPIHENVELDLFYIERRNIFLDLAILLRTVTAIVRGIGAA